MMGFGGTRPSKLLVIVIVCMCSLSLTRAKKPATSTPNAKRSAGGGWVGYTGICEPLPLYDPRGASSHGINDTMLPIPDGSGLQAFLLSSLFSATKREKVIDLSPTQLHPRTHRNYDIGH